MGFKFITNSISTRTKTPSLSDIVKAAQTKAAMEKSASQDASKSVVKTASTVTAPAPVKVAGEPGKGNIANLTAKPFGKKDKDCKEDDKDCKETEKEASVKVAEGDEGKSSGQPEAEAKLLNDPHADPKLKAGKSESKAKDSGEAESSGQLDVEPLHQKGESTGEKKTEEKEAKSTKNTKVAFKKMAKVAFKKTADLTSKQKEFLRKVYSLYYPKSYIDALLFDN